MIARLTGTLAETSSDSVTIAGPDAADALAVAITHAHHLATRRHIP